MRVSMASVAARVGCVNEDFCGAVPGAAVLIDGAGISGVESICRHGVAWYAHRLGGELLGLLSLGADRSLPALLAEAIARLADAHRNTCDLADPSSPSAAVAIVRLYDGRVDYLVLGDLVVVLGIAEAPLVVSDAREVDIGRPYRAALQTTADGSAEHEQVRRRFIDMLRASRNQPGGFWVAKDDPRAAAEAITGSRCASELSGVALLSNCASRIVDRFQLARWPEVLGLLASGGPTTIIRRVRQAEQQQGFPPDDATVLHCTDLAED